MTISDEAVEAAAAAMWEKRPMQRTNDGAPLPLGEAKYYQRVRYLDQASAALEAAAPYLMADAWEQGREDGLWSDMETHPEPNPYRKDQS